MERIWKQFSPKSNFIFLHSYQLIDHHRKGEKPSITEKLILDWQGFERSNVSFECIIPLAKIKSASGLYSIRRVRKKVTICMESFHECF